MRHFELMPLNREISLKHKEGEDAVSKYKENGKMDEVEKEKGEPIDLSENEEIAFGGPEMAFPN